MKKINGLKQLKTFLYEKAKIIKDWEEIDRKVNERDTENCLVLPLLRALNWDIENPDEVTSQHIEESKKRSDYALIINKKPVVLIEVKKFNKKLEGEQGQLFNYGLEEKINWLILTNGNEYRIFYKHSKRKISIKIKEDERDITFQQIKTLRKSIVEKGDKAMLREIKVSEKEIEKINRRKKVGIVKGESGPIKFDITPNWWTEIKGQNPYIQGNTKSWDGEWHEWAEKQYPEGWKNAGYFYSLMEDYISNDIIGTLSPSAHLDKGKYIRFGPDEKTAGKQTFVAIRIDKRLVVIYEKTYNKLTTELKNKMPQYSNKRVKINFDKLSEISYLNELLKGLKAVYPQLEKEN